MFDVDDFISDCLAAKDESEPRLAVRDVLTRALARPDLVATALDPTEGGIELLYRSDDLTVVHAVWAPGMRLYPHDHRMWAVIGIYAGVEENAFYRRSGDVTHPLAEAGGKVIDTGHVQMLGDDVIHAVANPGDRLTGAVHVYGGDFVDQPRSQWPPDADGEQPFDLDTVRRQFAEANAAWRAGAG